MSAQPGLTSGENASASGGDHNVLYALLRALAEGGTIGTQDRPRPEDRLRQRQRGASGCSCLT